MLDELMNSVNKMMVDGKIISDESGINYNTELIESEILDSLNLLLLLSLIEENFSIKISDEDFTMENFKTIASISDLVKRYIS